MKRILRESLRTLLEEEEVPAGANEYNATLAKLILRLKKDTGATMVKQGYRGTGDKVWKRQILVRWGKIGPLDIMLGANQLDLGVLYRPVGSLRAGIAYENFTPAEVYSKLVDVLEAWQKSLEPTT